MPVLALLLQACACLLGVGFLLSHQDLCTMYYPRLTFHSQSHCLCWLLLLLLLQVYVC
jgi:hypothetical protein